MSSLIEASRERISGSSTPSDCLSDTTGEWYYWSARPLLYYDCTLQAAMHPCCRCCRINHDDCRAIAVNRTLLTRIAQAASHLLATDRVLCFSAR
jgi:hypothetical protein